MKLYADNIDITATAGRITWQNTIAELATTLNFEVAKLDAQHTRIYLPTEGSIISLVTNAEVFRGIVLEVDDGAAESNKYTVCDFGFYLNKSKETYQFNDMAVFDLLAKVCADFGVEIDALCNIEEKITKIYLNKTISDIIRDVLEQCDGEFNFDVTPRGLRVYRIGEIYAYPQFRLSENTQQHYSVNLRGNVSRTRSIMDMKNSVKVIAGNEDAFELKAAERDEGLIARYGLLQDVITVDPEKENPFTVARETLAELARTRETFSFDIIEAMDSYTRAGSVLDIEGATFVIDGSGHRIENDVHYTQLELRRIA